jgi:hypothetical protein
MPGYRKTEEPMKHKKRRPQCYKQTIECECYACHKLWAQPAWYVSTKCPYCGAEEKTV